MILKKAIYIGLFTCLPMFATHATKFKTDYNSQGALNVSNGQQAVIVPTDSSNVATGSAANVSAQPARIGRTAVAAAIVAAPVAPTANSASNNTITTPNTPQSTSISQIKTLLSHSNIDVNKLLASSSLSTSQKLEMMQELELISAWLGEKGWNGEAIAGLVNDFKAKWGVEGALLLSAVLDQMNIDLEINIPSNVLLNLLAQSTNLESTVTAIEAAVNAATFTAVPISVMCM